MHGQTGQHQDLRFPMANLDVRNYKHGRRQSRVHGRSMRPEREYPCSFQIRFRFEDRVTTPTQLEIDSAGVNPASVLAPPISRQLGGLPTRPTPRASSA